METRWVHATELAALVERGRTLVRLEGRQIALFVTGGEVFACNNRCPHEGYPLREGTLAEDCVLTCNWHNWKFDLRDGRNLYGGDRLRVYPVETRNGGVWVDLAEPDVQTRRTAVIAQLRDAFDDNAYERMAREIGRLIKLGVDPVEALVEAIGWSWDRLEFGWTHAFAGAADWLDLYDSRADEEERLVCLLECVAHLADDVLREPAYPYPDGSFDWDEERFVAAVESEDQATACALVRGALADGLEFADLEAAFTRAALAHYNDFGHALIYVTKARRLCDRLGERCVGSLLLSLTRKIVFATREDLVPEFKRYARHLQGWGQGAATAPAVCEWAGLGIDRALALAGAASAAEPASLRDSLLGANASNWLRFDLAQQHKIRIPISANVGWLDFTHGITFANAIREQCPRFPETWPQALLQLACFSGRNARYTDDSLDVAPWRVADPGAFVDEVIEDLLDHDRDEFDHDRDEFIVSVHLLKTTLAIRDELRAGVSQEIASSLAAALNRFLASPLKRKQPRRTAHQALAFVAKE